MLWRAEKEGDLTYGVTPCELPANENAMILSALPRSAELAQAVEMAFGGK
jgi:hypothetical protein